MTTTTRLPEEKCKACHNNPVHLYTGLYIKHCSTCPHQSKFDSDKLKNKTACPKHK